MTRSQGHRVPRREVLRAALAAPMVLLAAAAPPVRVGGRTIFTDELGWKNDEDVGSSGQMARLIGGLSSGDTVVFSDNYRLCGAYDLARLGDITFRAAQPGRAGFVALDGTEDIAERHKLPVNNAPVFTVGPGTRVEGLVFRQPPGDPSRWPNGGRKGGWFAATRADRIVVSDNTFDCAGWIHLRFHSCPNLLIEGNTFKDGKWCTFLVGACDDMVFRNNFGTGGYRSPVVGSPDDDIFIDIVKTMRTAEGGPKRALIEHNRFIDLARDAIDTTGGFEGAMIRNNLFRNVAFASLDIKSIYRTPDELALGPAENLNVAIEDNIFENAGIVLTTIWPPDDKDAAPELAVRDIRLARNRFVRTPGSPTREAVLMKNCAGLSMNGDIIEGQPLLKVWDQYTPTRVRGVRLDGVVVNTDGAETVLSGADFKLDFAKATVSGGSSALITLENVDDAVVAGRIVLEPSWSSSLAAIFLRDRVAAILLRKACSNVRLALEVAHRGTERSTGVSVDGAVTALAVTGRFANIDDVVAFSARADAHEVTVAAAKLDAVQQVFYFARGAEAAGVSATDLEASPGTRVAGGWPPPSAGFEHLDRGGACLGGTASDAPTRCAVAAPRQP